MLYGDNNFIENDNIIYTIDMLRLRCDITFSQFTKLEFKLKLIYSDMIKNVYQSFGISDFKYNYNIEISNKYRTKSFSAKQDYVSTILGFLERSHSSLSLNSNGK